MWKITVTWFCSRILTRNFFSLSLSAGSKITELHIKLPFFRFYFKFTERRNNNHHKYKNKTFIREYPHIPPPIISEPTDRWGGWKVEVKLLLFPRWQRPCAYLEAKDSHWFKKQNKKSDCGKPQQGCSQCGLYEKRDFWCLGKT